MARRRSAIGILRLTCAGVLLALLWHAAGVRLPSIARAATGDGGAQEPVPASRDELGAYAVGTVTLTLVDRRRTIRLSRGRTEPRTLVTYVRYPALGGPAGAELLAPPPAPGRFPLVVFAHGFDDTPATYGRLLASWARAGYVVAAPLFPLTNPRAPGGADESDVVNQPSDVSFVISQLLGAAAPAGPVSRQIDPRHIAVAGHSDGAETALAVAYSRRYRDPRISAAVILSGAELSGIGGYEFVPRGPALLATQGTKDSLNEPRYTYAYFHSARRPKYLLRLLGAGHLPPYTTERAQLTTVESVTRSFLDAYLKGAPGAPAALARFGNVGGIAALVSDP